MKTRRGVCGNLGFSILTADVSLGETKSEAVLYPKMIGDRVHRWKQAQVDMAIGRANALPGCSERRR